MNRIVFDCECYRDYFLVMFRSIATGKTYHYEMYEGKEFNARVVMAILRKYETVGFNSWNYDVPMLTLAAAGADNMELKLASDYLVTNPDANRWNFEKRFQVKLPDINHIDLMEVAPGYMISLKLYGGRLHSKTLQDLPIEPNASISPDDRVTLIDYCANDLNTTIDLHNKLVPQLRLREQMSEQYGIDLRSKSDAQIAEAVIKSKIEAIQGKRLYRPENVADTFQYVPPKWLHYESEQLHNVLEIVRSAHFSLKDSGQVDMPKEIAGLEIAIGDSVYRMGIGGLHSSESKVSHVADGTFRLFDRDVASYYPSIILNEHLYPKNLGEDFLDVYRSIVEERLDAKRSGNKVVADSLKITINGSFGKLGSKWSVLYAPSLMIQVTITGQLALLMLIEHLESEGIPVVSANTDGIVIKCPVGREGAMDEIVFNWEKDTAFETEQTEYAALYSRDVNNYIALKPDGNVKVKGVYADPGLAKNPVTMVATKAVVALLTQGTPIIQTVRQCQDVTDFLTVRSVAGGAVQADKYLGKVVRWYYSTQSPGIISYKTNGNKVARSDGSVAMMTLGPVPKDLDYDWYIREAESILNDCGGCAVYKQAA